MLTMENMPGTVTGGECFVSHGEITKNGKNLKFRTDAQEFLFVNEEGETEASIFAFSQFLEDGEAMENRPVLFVYAGGPGCASNMMYLGFFGPVCFDQGAAQTKRSVPPYQLAENADWLIDVCDIVMVDPVGTGFAKLYKEDCSEKYFGVEGDAAAFRKFVTFWLNQYGRWNSPKFICGESYGAMRSAVYPYYLLGGAMDPQLGQFGIALNGTIILSDVNVGDLSDMKNPRMGAPDQPGSLNLLATFAAIHRFHGPEGKPSLRDFIDEAHRFAYDVYARALLLGEALSAEERQKVAEKLSYFTGLPAALLLQNGLKLDKNLFASQLLAAQGKTVSLYDGRRTAEAAAQKAALYDSSADDPFLMDSWSQSIAMIHDHMRGALGITWDREYLAQNYQACWNWDFSMTRPAQTNDLLSVAACRNPQMRIFIGKGIYDCVAPIGDGRYTLYHYNLPKERVTYREYEAGHTVWSGPEAKKKFAADLREFICNSI